MTPAEKRIKELIDRWLASIELHLQYVELSDEAYAEIQNWPKHDRPTRWVLETAKQKLKELKDAFDARHKMGDGRFADALELMAFVSNLVGAQHVDRFIPLADPLPESNVPKPMPRQVSASPVTSDVPKWYAQAHASSPATPAVPKAAVQTSAPQVAANKPTQSNLNASRANTEASAKPAQRVAESEATREMPNLRTPSAQPAQPPKSEPKKSPPKSATPQASGKQNAKLPEPTDELQKKVMADAVRLLGWGRTWHELAELIARMADRPPLAEVRKILRTYRETIEKSAKEAAK